MTSALALTSSGPLAPPLADDLQAVGIQLLGVSTYAALLPDTIKLTPDLIVCFEQTPDTTLFSSTMAVGATAPRPTAVFTTDPDAEKIVLATRSSIHAYVVNGYSRNRLRSVLQLAQARFRHEQVIRQELADVQQRFEERKLVDRAKGILMGARQLREEEAFRALRSAAMAAKQRIGQVSQLVIDSARYAEAVNRAGQLRMLSQRLVKLYALQCAGVAAEETARLLADSLTHIDSNLTNLGRSLSKSTFGDLLEAVTIPWQRLRNVLKSAATVSRLIEVDELAGKLLENAEQLTANLEVAAFANVLHVINVAGRQRMLTQRLAKETLLAALLPPKDAAAARKLIAATTAELVQGLAFLAALPMSNGEIAAEVGQANRVWLSFQESIAQSGSPSGRERIAHLSETLQDHFDRLTNSLERSIQTMIG